MRPTSQFEAAGTSRFDRIVRDVFPSRGAKLSWPVLALTSALLAGCASVGPDFKEPAAAVQSEWSADEMDSVEVPSSDVWWSGFKDPVLEQLIRRANEQNLDLALAGSRVQQARLELAIARREALPSAQLSSASSYTSSTGQTGPDSSTRSVDVEVPISWELDFWGKVRRGVEENRAEWRGSLAAWQTARVSIESAVATAYFDLLTYQERLRVAEGNLSSQAENLRIANARFRAGASSELDMQQSQAQYEQTKAGVPLLRASVAQAGHALSVLIAGTPETYLLYVDQTPQWPTMPTISAAGIPRDLLRRRPDIREAEYTAAAASARIGQASAALYPTFTLAGSFGASASNVDGGSLNDIFSWSNPVRSFSASVLLPLFDRRSLKYKVQVQEALWDQSELSYQATVLQAQQEVEDALSYLVNGKVQLQSLEKAVAAASRSAELALLRYKAGETDYTTVISADQTRLDAEDALAQAIGDQLQAHVELFRALGGGWDGQLNGAAGERNFGPDSVYSTFLPGSRPQQPGFPTRLSHVP